MNFLDKIGGWFGKGKNVVGDVASKGGDVLAKGKDAIGGAVNQGKEKLNNLVHSDVTENVSDSVLNGVANVANKVTGGKFSEQIEDTKNNIDKNIGNDKK